jgi:uncharacterized protein (UPF0333 family)
MLKRRGQISIEYLIVVAFVVFLVISIVGFGFYYVRSTSDSIKVNQINNYANKIVSNAEAVFYSGNPSKISISAYLPRGVDSVEIIDNDLVFTFSTSTGTSKIAYDVDVPLAGDFSASEGVKVLELTAGDTGVIAYDLLTGNCGDDELDAGEQCDNTDLAGQNCVSLGFTGGLLGCSSSCVYDTMSCTSATCGNEVIEGAEQCDGSKLNFQTCVSQGFDSGVLACDGSCNYDTSACSSVVVLSVAFEGSTPADAVTVSGPIEVDLVSTSGESIHYSFLNLDSSLVYWYRFEDGVVGGADTSDESGNSFDGEMMGDAAISSSDGYFDQGISFDGSGDYIAVRTHSYSGSGIVNGVTACAWVAVTNGATQRMGFFDYDRSDFWSLGINFHNAAGGAGKVSWDTAGSTGGVDDMLSTIAINDDVWRHVCAVYDSSIVNDKKIYINGVLDSEKDAYSTGVGLGIGNTRYGIIGDGSEASSYDGGRNGFYYDGKLDELILFDRALSEDEIESLYDSSANQYLNTFSSLSLGGHTFEGYAVDETGVEQTGLILVTLN